MSCSSGLPNVMLCLLWKSVGRKPQASHILIRTVPVNIFVIHKEFNERDVYYPSLLRRIYESRWKLVWTFLTIFYFLFIFQLIFLYFTIFLNKKMIFFLNTFTDRNEYFENESNYRCENVGDVNDEIGVWDQSSRSTNNKTHKFMLFHLRLLLVISFFFFFISLSLTLCWRRICALIYHLNTLYRKTRRVCEKK